MATIDSPTYSDALSFGYAGSIKAVDTGDIAVKAADLAINNLVKLVRMPKGFVVTGVAMMASDLDTNGTPALTMALGDAGDDDRFIAASNIGQAGGTTTTLAAAGTFYKFPADTDVFIKFPAAAATGADGTVRAVFIGYHTQF